ncbi:UDP-glucose dehydrogenase family protein [Nocardioides montaniterrae]
MTLRISVIGTGYLGATHAACLAELGFDVVAIDNDEAKIASLARGELPFTEPGLPELLASGIASGRLRFATSLDEAADCDVHFICVGTPQSATGRSADLTAVFTVTRRLARVVRRDSLLVGKSTVPVGTAAALRDMVAETVAGGVRLDVAWNPEFLREGYAVQDTLHPDRLVLGVADGGEGAVALLRKVYAAALADGTPLHVTDLATAELAKVAANSFLATKISFINAIAEVSDRSGADVVALADILGDDTRIGRRFLDAGVGFGGGCLPKDIRAFAARADELGARGIGRLLGEVDDINARARSRVAELVVDECGGDVRGLRIGVLGAAFKPGSDDVRDSPALAVAAALKAAGAEVRVYDPEAALNARAVHPQLTYVASVAAALTGADAVVHLTEWPEFREIDPVAAAGLVRRKVVIDARNKLDHDRWAEAGWKLVGIGRGSRRTSKVVGAGWLIGEDAAEPRATPRERLRALLARG